MFINVNAKEALSGNIIGQAHQCNPDRDRVYTEPKTPDKDEPITAVPTECAEHKDKPIIPLPRECNEPMAPGQAHHNRPDSVN